MSLTVGVLVVIVVLLVLMAMGQPVAFAMGAVGLLGIYTMMGSNFISAVENILWRAPNNIVLTSIPLFIFMSEALLRIGISNRLYRGLTPWLGRFPGGLLHSNIGACAVFAAICGSSPATAATIGTVAIPELEKQKYDSYLTVGSIAGGGTLGILIPPSITMIIYASMVGESVGQLFMAGVIPGILMAILFMIYIAIKVSLQPQLAPKRQAISWKDSFLALTDVVPSLLLILMVLGTIYLGMSTPTEAAALGSAGALLLGLAYRTLTWQNLKEATLNATRVSCALMFIFIGAQFLALVMAYLGLPIRLAETLKATALPPLSIMAGIYVLYLILGCFFDPMSMMVLTLPVVYPVIKALGFDGVWFGIILVILVEAGMLTPPVGLNLYVIQAIAPQYRFDVIVRGITPFVLIQILMIVLLTAFPTIALWLPTGMRT